MVVGYLESRPITTALKLNWGMNHYLRNSADKLPQSASRDACQEPAVNMAVLGLIRVQRTSLSDSLISSSPSGWLTRYSHSARRTINSSRTGPHSDNRHVIRAPWAELPSPPSTLQIFMLKKYFSIT